MTPEVHARWIQSDSFWFPIDSYFGTFVLVKCSWHSFNLNVIQLHMQAFESYSTSISEWDSTSSESGNQFKCSRCTSEYMKAVLTLCRILLQPDSFHFKMSTCLNTLPVFQSANLFLPECPSSKTKNLRSSLFYLNFISQEIIWLHFNEFPYPRYMLWNMQRL